MMEEDQAPVEVTAEILIDYYNMGLKLVPLNEEGKPLYSWTEIYDNPDYWTPESLRKHVNDFKGVATAFGKTRIKDENGLDLYLHCFDIDSENAYETTVVNALNGVLHKSGVSLEDTVEIIRRLAKDDSTSDRRNAEKKVKDTYKKDCAVVSGWVIFSEALEAATGDTSKSNEILGNIRSILDSYKQEETEAAGMIPRDPEYLFALAQKEIKEQFRDQTTGAYYAVIEEEGRKKRLNMDHEEFDLFLSDIFLKSRHKILSKEISNNVKRTLKPQTKEERILYNRVTQIDHTLYYDLCNRKVL
jgi:hypothetical protein